MASLVCNFPQGRAFMEHQQVVTFFHEMGHLLHHILGGQQDWASQSGIETEWDFVETPSQLLEEWAWRHDTLSKFALNSEGQPLSKNMSMVSRLLQNSGKQFTLNSKCFMPG